MADLEYAVAHPSDDPQTVAVELSGAIDSTTFSQFQECLAGLEGEGVKRLILDMEKITYVNSTGFSLLIQQADLFAEPGSGLVLIRVHPKVKVVLQMLGLDAFFKIFTNLDDAVASFDVGAPAPAPEPAAAPPRRRPHQPRPRSRNRPQRRRHHHPRRQSRQPSLRRRLSRRPRRPPLPWHSQRRHQRSLPNLN